MKLRITALSPIAILATLFFVFGFVTWLNGTLIPFLQLVCDLSTFQAMLVTFAFYVSYFVMAYPSSIILERISYKNGMASGLFIMAVGSLIFIPAAFEKSYFIFLLGLFTQGTGLCLLQTASNPYIVVLGSNETAARRIAIMGLFNKFAGVISPIILGTIALGGADEIKTRMLAADNIGRAILQGELAHRIISPYLVIAVGLFALGLLIVSSSLPEIEDSNIQVDHAKSNRLRDFPQLTFGFWAIFFGVAVEVVAGDTIAMYGKSLGMSLDVTRFFTSATLVCMMGGYTLGIVFVPTKIDQLKALKLSAIAGAFLSVGIIFMPGAASIACVALLGLANAMLWPSIFPLALNGVGEKTKKASAILVMGIIGGALIPSTYAAMAGVIGDRFAYALLIPMYGYLFLYSKLRCHRNAHARAV